MIVVDLSKETIDKIFVEAEDQLDYIMKLYAAVIPEFNKVHHLYGYPEVSEVTTAHIFQKAMEFDRKHHPEVINGGGWINYGFKQSDKVEDWKAQFDPDIVEWEEHPDERAI